MPWPKWLTSAAALLEEPVAETESASASESALTPAQSREQQILAAQNTAQEALQTELQAKRTAVESNRVGLKEVPNKYATHFEAREDAVILEDVAAAKKDVSELERLFSLQSGQFLPIEVDALTMLEKTHTTSKTRIEERVKRFENECIAAQLDRRFNRIDMSFLSMCNWSPKNQCAVPMFGIFTINDPVCRLSLMVRMGYNTKTSRREAQGTWNNVKNPHLVEFINKDFLLHQVANRMYNDRPVEAIAETRFAGVIPVEIRELIRKEQHAFESIFIISEVNDWDISLVPEKVVPIDPLVIGEKLGQFYLLGVFDTTPAEQFVAENYTKKMPEQK